MIKVSDYIAKRLVEYGIKHIFMISGGGAMHLNDSFGKNPYIEYICNHNEQASAIAAEGYARVNQDLAVVNVTTGPGGINALNGVFGQWTDSAPVLYISGQVKFTTTIHSCPELNLRQLGDQEVDIISVVKPLTKYAYMIRDPYEVGKVLDKAIYLATHGRKGPVWIDVPMNIQAAMIDEEKLEKYDLKEDELVFDKELFIKQLQETIELLKKAKSPIIIAGHGITISKSNKVFQELIDKLKIPVVTTINGFDIMSSDNEFYVGRIGTVAHRAGNFALQNADLVISLGSRNNIRQVSYNWENFAAKAKKIVVDIDKAELEKPTLKPDIAIHADVADFISEFNQQMYDEKFCVSSNWLAWCKKMQSKYPPVIKHDNKNNLLEPYSFLEKLSSLYKEGDINVSGNGTAFLGLFQAGIVKKDQRFIWNSGDASMGYDLPAAIGACIANNKKDVICLAGDGSIMMNLQELQTVKHYNLPIKIFILNNDGYISIRQTHNNFFEGRLTACSRGSGVSIPDFVKVAKAFGLPAATISNSNNLEEEIKNVLNHEGPIVCEVMLETDYIFQPKLSARKLEDGTMVSPSLEDMYPFLDREEFEENIYKK